MHTVFLSPIGVILSWSVWGFFLGAVAGASVAIPKLLGEDSHRE